MDWRDRIKELRRVPASELMPHPMNYRRHPRLQVEALQGILAEVGFADAVMARETPEGLQLIDGHLRAEIAGDAVVPVLVLDVTEEESHKLLAALDPLASMADSDVEALRKLLDTIETEDVALSQMLEELARDSGAVPPDFEPASIDEQGRLDEKAKVKCPECGHEFTP